MKKADWKPRGEQNTNLRNAERTSGMLTANTERKRETEGEGESREGLFGAACDDERQKEQIDKVKGHGRTQVYSLNRPP